MPERDGRMTDQERDRIDAWAAAHWQRPRACPVCSRIEWALYEHLLRDDHAAMDITIGADAQCVVYFTFRCLNCGYAMRIDALAAGVCQLAAVPE